MAGGKAKGDEVQGKDALRGELQLMKCAKRLEQFSTGRFRDAHGSSLSRFDVLANLSRGGGSLPTSALAAGLIASQGNITRLLDRMEADGLIERGAHERDRRISVVRLTAAGEAAFEGMAADHEH
ncbi:MAG: MarR family winged helix-turn-helix transcriptional regulator, partial [Gammaproteobacteria bacterium]